MAQVPALNGPSVGQSAAPTPLQNEQAPSTAFGATVAGAGLSETGQAAQGTSDALQQHALALQSIYNKQAADTAGFGAAAAVDSLVGKWRETNTLGKAVATLPDLLQQIEQTRNGFGEGLTPLAKADFEQLSRRATFSSISQATNYAVQQGHEGLIKGADATAKLAVQLYSTNPTPENEALMHEQVGKSLAQQFTSAGLTPDDPQVKLASLDYMSKGYATVISNAYQSGNLELANQLLQAHKGDLTDSDYRAVSGSLRVANTANNHLTEAQAILDGGVVNPRSGSIYNAIGGEEWKGTGPAPTSAKGAVGNSQIMPATAVQYGLASNVAEATQKLQDPAFAQHAKQVVIDAISDLPNVKGDPARIAVGYFSGAGNIAPLGSPTPWIKDTNDGHENVSDYVAHVTAHVGAGTQPMHMAGVPQLQPGQDPNLYLAQAETELQKQAVALHPDNVAEQRAVFQAGMELAKMRVEPVIAQNKANFDTVSDWMVKNNVQDMAQVQAQFPSEVATMGHEYTRTLESYAQNNAQRMTPERSANIDLFNGLMTNAKNDPQAFLNADPRKVDMPLSYQQQFIKAQDKLKAWQQQETTATVGANRAFQLAPVTAAMDSLGFAKNSQGHVDRTSPEAMRFSGMLYADLEHWAQANPGKKLDDKTIIQQAAQLTARVGATPGLFGTGIGANPGTSAAQLAPADNTNVTNWFQNKFHRAPEAWEVGYWAQQARNARGGQ